MARALRGGRNGHHSANPILVGKEYLILNILLIFKVNLDIIAWIFVRIVGMRK